MLMDAAHSTYPLLESDPGLLHVSRMQQLSRKRKPVTRHVLIDERIPQDALIVYVRTLPCPLVDFARQKQARLPQDVIV